jgi:hypothetical protein
MMKQKVLGRVAIAVDPFSSKMGVVTIIIFELPFVFELTLTTLP